MNKLQASAIAVCLLATSVVAPAVAQVPGPANTPAPAGSPVGGPSAPSPAATGGAMTTAPAPGSTGGAMSTHPNAMGSPTMHRMMPETGMKSHMKVPGRHATVRLRPQNGSGETGRADLYEVGDGVRVLLKVNHGPTSAQPAHIHAGTCATLNPTPAYPLTSVVAGTSTTFVPNLKLATLLASPFAINVHKSASAIKTYVACGNILPAKKHHHGAMKHGGAMTTPDGATAPAPMKSGM